MENSIAEGFPSKRMEDDFFLCQVQPERQSCSRLSEPVHCGPVMTTGTVLLSDGGIRHGDSDFWMLYSCLVWEPSLISTYKSWYSYEILIAIGFGQGTLEGPGGHCSQSPQRLIDQTHQDRSLNASSIRPFNAFQYSIGYRHPVEVN